MNDHLIKLILKILEINHEFSTKKKNKMKEIFSGFLYAECVCECVCVHLCMKEYACMRFQSAYKMYAYLMRDSGTS